jgi:hypothetical protein
MKLAKILAWVQGAYFFIFGLWPLFSIETFEAVAGEKTDNLVTGLEADHWLVYTVGLLIAVIGATLLVSAWRDAVSLEITLLGGASALALGAIDAVYVARQTILPIYLADAGIEALFVAGWVAAGVRERSAGSRTS